LFPLLFIGACCGIYTELLIYQNSSLIIKA
jgi:hypothetical protein